MLIRSPLHRTAMDQRAPVRPLGFRSISGPITRLDWEPAMHGLQLPSASILSLRHFILHPTGDMLLSNARLRDHRGHAGAIVLC